MKKVLIIEDDERWQRDWKTALQGKFEIVSAFSQSEAYEKAIQHPNIAGTVLDACIPGSIINTEPLVCMLVVRFPNKPIIVASNYTFYRIRLMQIGCTNSCDKVSLPAKLCEILGSSA